MNTEHALAAIRARHAAATPGPWQPSPPHGPHYVANVSGQNLRGVGHLYFDDGDAAAANREFVLHAHTDMTVLLNEVERLQKQLAHAGATALNQGADELDALADTVEARVLDYYRGTSGTGSCDMLRESATTIRARAARMANRTTSTAT